jgi:sugar O-acyltransferase (sialic acid O-acetyltransferase NeuD family)
VNEGANVAGAEKLIIAGNSAFAEIAYEYFTHDSPYDVVGFTVDKRFLAKDTLFGLPNVPFEDVESVFAPAEHHLYAASTYTSLNRLRTRFTVEAKRKGYRLASYVSSRAFVWRNVEIGEHCFIFEDNTVQPFVKLGNNVVLWSGNHIGHHSTVGDNVFIASHVVVSGFCAIGENTFIGVNATIANNVAIAQDNLIGAGATILRSTSENQMYGAEATKAKENRTARQYFGID